ncbi:unnamed protein product, partial [Acidithrix sp. C25]
VNPKRRNARIARRTDKGFAPYNLTSNLRDRILNCLGRVLLF